MLTTEAKMSAVKRLVFVTAVFVFASFADVASAQSPNDIVDSAVAMLAERMDGRKEEFAQDKQALYALVNEMLLPRFDRKYAAQLVLGKHWRSADEAQRQRFIAAFYDSLLHRYADGLLEFDADRVKVIAFRGDASKKRTTVKTIVRLNDGTKVAVNYGLVMRDAGWLMFDVTIEGVSYIRNYRAEMDSEIRATSLVAVIERLEAEAGITAHE
jgi:phospholipid transport system substrate-binding protein